MKAYTAYKRWWKITQAPNLIPSLYWGETVEEAFVVHISKMSLYELMEKLEDWNNDE
jgi:hypothetical protein